MARPTPNSSENSASSLKSTATSRTALTARSSGPDGSVFGKNCAKIETRNTVTMFMASTPNKAMPRSTSMASIRSDGPTGVVLPVIVALLNAAPGRVKRLPDPAFSPLFLGWRIAADRSRRSPIRGSRRRSDVGSVLCQGQVAGRSRSLPEAREILSELLVRGLEVPRAEEDGRLEGPPSRHQAGRPLARRVRGLLQEEQQAR